MGQVLQFKRPAAANKTTTEAPAAPVGATLADNGAWSPAEVPALDAAVLERLAHLVAEAERLPVHEYLVTEDDFAEFGAQDFVDMSRLYKALGAPELVSLDSVSWRRVHLAIATVAVPAFKLLTKPKSTQANRWRQLSPAMVSYVEAVARGTASAEDWRAVHEEHQRVYGHLPMHSGE